jgi:hypothetical protein
MNSDDHVLKALSNLGLNEEMPSLCTLQSLERFVVDAYGKSKLPPNVTTLPSLR